MEMNNMLITLFLCFEMWFYLLLKVIDRETVVWYDISLILRELVSKHSF